MRCLSLFLIVIISTHSACDFLEVEPPSSTIDIEGVFADDVSAIAAMSGVYIELYRITSFAGGGTSSITALSGLSSDELLTMSSDIQFLDFEKNSLKSENLNVLALWTTMYKSIYQVNALLEGLDKSSSVTDVTRNQLKGEALFVRAFCHFYLVNCFGDVPIVLSTDHEVNSSISRASVDEVYEQIESDLLQAEDLLSENYPTSGKVRPNKLTVTAMLARMYLYREDWQRAEDKATNVISKNTLYGLVSDPHLTFLINSSESIWQLKPPDGSDYTHEGYVFGSFMALQNNVLNETLVEEFDANDKRKQSWITSVSSNSVTRFLPFKYKDQDITVGVETSEASMVLRLAEQYLIRSEARLEQDKLNLAIADLDVIRKRAGILLIQETNPAINKDSLMLMIRQERKLELFAEWGHRWFDLKRWDQANNVLSPIKPNWSTHDQLYPLPAQELRINKALAPQNPNY